MTYISLPLSFMHPNSIVMHPPKSLALAGLPLYGAGENELYASAATYVVMQSAGHRSMLDRVALYSGSVETILHMHANFGTAGELRYSLLDAGGNAVLEKQAWLADGSGQHGIEMSGLTPGRYSLLVSWQDEEEESAVMYQIEKLQ